MLASDGSSILPINLISELFEHHVVGDNSSHNLKCC